MGVLQLQISLLQKILPSLVQPLVMISQKVVCDNTSGASIGVTDEAANYSTWSSGDDGGSGFDAQEYFKLMEPRVTI